MINFIVTGDWHIKGINPRNRIDDYMAAFEEKMREVFKLAKEYDAQAIICPGDVFDSPDVANGVLLRVYRLLQEAPCLVLVASGNHCIYGYNIDTLERTSLNLLQMLLPKFRVNSRTPFWDDQVQVETTFQPYTSKVDIEGWGYSYTKGQYSDHAVKIHVVHGMLLDHVPPFERYSLVQNVETNADVVITGHDHTGYGIYQRADGKLFINPGALMRIAASVGEIERPIQVALLEVGEKITARLIPLACAKPGDQVLDRSKIEADQKRAYAMEKFASLIEAEGGEKVAINIDEIIAKIAEKENIAPIVVAKALAKIAVERGRL